VPIELAEHLQERWGEHTVIERRGFILTLLSSVIVKPATTKKLDPARVELVWR
jgi:hypothetical protein